MGKRSAIVLMVLAAAVAVAAVRDPAPGLYDHLVLQREGGVISIRGVELERLTPGDPQRQAWSELHEELGGEWKVWLDERTALPSLVVVRGQRWRSGGRAPELDNLDEYAALTRNFLQRNPAVAGPFDSGLEFVPRALRPRFRFACPVLGRHALPSSAQSFGLVDRFSSICGVAPSGRRGDTHTHIESCASAESQRDSRSREWRVPGVTRRWQRRGS